MRLVCPSCEAKYEVPDDAIPDTGRDVQCANCGHAWFQMRSRAPTTMPPVVAPRPAPAADPAPVAAAEPEDSAVEAPDAPPAIRELPPRPQNEEVLAILREEAEREAKERREKTRIIGTSKDLEAEAAPDVRKKSAPRKKDAAAAEVAVQPVVEAPVPEAEPVVAKAPEPMPEPVPSPASAPIPVAEPVAVSEVDTELKVAARRDLLPDVEEIKSTLQPTEEPEPEFLSGPQADLVVREARGAFRSGFLTVISIAILAGSIYTSAEWISTKLPALSGLLTAYVSALDELRLQLDGLMRVATRLISGDKA